ncbi:Protein CHROMATIN REMODELING 8 [Camellia lanceoleosa]|uniref:Protein CHROMATIN REMODELING 8 n=1 Tax=Camellia lanceoleosa TaxID=1840588 RepID=A0ACC0F5R8_9ERIC|nr:Protein CHROMATIN REMODELING 8 [Camellia lanceoleosa]
MEEDEEDRVLLSSLGITSANPEDIERDLLAEVRNNAGEISEAGGSTEEELLGSSKNNELLSTSHADVYSKLRAVEIEIDAVASSVEQVKNLARNENHVSDGYDGEEQGEKEDERSILQSSCNDLTLQHALATDRLRSLKKTKAQLEKEISNLCKDDPSKSSKHDKLIQDLVKEERRPKSKLKELQKSSKNPKKRQKIVSFDEDGDFDAVLNTASAGFVETERDELVRKGILTPFHKLKGFERRIQQPGPSNRDNVLEEEDKTDDLASTSIAKAVRSLSEAAQARPTTKLLNSDSLPKLEAPTRPFRRLKTPLKIPRSPESETGKNKGTLQKKRRPLPAKKWRKLASHEGEPLEESDAKGDVVTCSNEEEDQEDGEDVDAPEASFVTLEGGLKIPETIFSKLFDYQKVGVQWLWELHCQRAGGIIGDEMGLGKTIQVLSFLGALHFSDMYKPSIIICPVTLLRQWRREAQKWYPSFHVEILHDSAQDPSSRKKRAESHESDYESEELLGSDNEENLSTKNTKKWGSLINRVLRSQSGLLITTYEQLRLHGEKLLDIEWGYAVLDEGHRIRNPNAEITLVCKQLQTVHRIIMTGAPIQNKLAELWSLFDFVFPGKLGVLPVFESEFAVPISVGGYANASPLQVSTAYRCAVVLRDLIMPYLLRRMKSDVNAHLPKKTEHVLFCSLTAEQRSVYRAFLASSDVEQIFDGNRNSLFGIDVMRKICNHPDLLEREHSFQNPDYGNPERSGKMKVIAQVLKVWKEQGHRVLLFSQTQQMLDIVENFLTGGEYNYRRMDGLTPIRQRMALIDEFNHSDDIFIFILTTKVGGLGTNLTGANRVIIFDPDWNPSTDMQARERAWRIGQTKDVTIYRLITRGTIEEKVYHRQIYKHFLTNKILKNPQQRRFFKARDMKDLFTLNDDENSGSTETSNIFGQLSEDVNIVGAQKDNEDKQKSVKMTAANADDAAVERGNNSEIGPSKRKGKEKADHSDGEVDEETNIIRSLFDAHGIHSAVNHDVIMNAHDEEKMRLEDQASQVAQRAAEALRQSRMLRSQESISVPTWTGRSGAAGAPSAIRRKFGATVNSQLINNSKRLEESSSNGASVPNGFAAGASAGKVLSSAELLARIRGNQERAVGDGIEHQFGLASSSGNRERSVDNDKQQPSRSSRNLSGVQPEVLIRQICTFIQQRGGRTNSAGIVEHFKNRVPSKDLPLFKNLLKEIATLEKDSNGSFWVLKPDYQQ